MLNEDKLMNMELVDNKKLNEAILLLQDLYTHMYKRIGVPDLNNFKFGNEGAASLHITLMIPPFHDYPDIALNPAGIIAVNFNTGLLARKEWENRIQGFDSIEKFYQQVKNWHQHEMSLSLEDKNAYFSLDTND